MNETWEERVARVRSEREAQGLPPTVEDEALLTLAAAAFRRGLLEAS